MATPTKEGGYKDRAALAKVVATHRQLIVAFRQLIDADGMTALRRNQILAQIGAALAEQGAALSTMMNIRSE